MLYRRQSGPVNVWLTVGTALVALLLGFVGGRLTAPPVTLVSLLQPAALHLRQASGALDIVTLEYARALKGNVQSQAASLKALEQAQTELSAAEALQRLYPQQVAGAGRALTAASRAIRQQASQELVEGRVAEVRTVLMDLIARVPH